MSEATPAHFSDISVIVLAGGAGTRVHGQDKGWLHYAGQPLVVRVLNRLHAQVGQILISANRNLPRYRDLGHAVVTDAVAGYPGPWTAIASTWPYATCPYVLTWPVDVPHWRLEWADLLRAALESQKANAAAWHVAGRRHPLLALYRRNAAVAASLALGPPNQSVHQWQDRIGVVEVVSPHPEPLLDLNEHDCFECHD